MIKVRPSQAFDFESEDLVSEVGQRTSDTSSAPTIDDRANLYLNAVYGAREFKGEEYAKARRIILDAMTIDVGMGLEEIVEDPPAQENSAPLEHHHEALAAFPSVDDTDPVSLSDAGFDNVHIRRQLPAANVELEAFDKDLEFEPHEEAARQLRRIFPRHKARRRSLLLFAAIAGCLAFVAITTVTLPLVLQGVRTESNTIALSPDEIKTLLSSSNSLQVVETAAPRRPASSEFAGQLFDLGNKLVAGGDMYGGRLILQEAANEGQASAAFALGGTFDPIEAKVLGRPDSSPDFDKARAWYVKAKLLGSTEAQARLDRLEKYRR